MKNDLISIVNNELVSCDKDLVVSTNDKIFLVKLMSFIESNKWFSTNPSLEYDENEKALIVFEDEDVETISQAIIKWLYVYNSDLEDQYKRLHELLTDQYNMTGSLLKKYYNNFDVDLKHKVEISEYLLYHLKSEVTYYNNELLDRFIEDLCNDKSLSLGMIICDFLAWVSDSFNTSYTNKYKLSSRSSGRSNTTAYDSNTFLKLVYYLFNSAYIEDNDTIHKISTSSKSADAFLYLSLHFICGLRDSDLLRLPRPIIEHDPKLLLESLENGIYSNEEARKVVNSIEFQLHNAMYTPSKTSKYSGISDLKFFVPESCREIIGKYYAAAESHRQLSNSDSDKPLIRVITNPYDLGGAMGEDFFELFLEENFSSRRANKAYLQAIEVFADDVSSDIAAPKGYILAALARSHKGGYGEFSKTTEIYLKDANFSGLTPEFVAKELFERGVCSFIPHMLLTMVESNNYCQLPVSKQTLIISELNMTPNEIENMISVIDEKKAATIKIINSIVDNEGEDNRQSILKILHNIGSGSAASKQNDCMCLLTAMNRICDDPERQHCIGCKYEIGTKSLIYHLSGEFKRLKSLINETDDMRVKNKNNEILSNLVLPAMEEILEYSKINYGPESVGDFEDIIRRYTI